MTTIAGTDYAASALYQLGRFSIDEARPIRVVVIGAGYSGRSFISAHKLPSEIRIIRYHSRHSVGLLRRTTILNEELCCCATNSFRQKVPNLSLSVYDSNAGVGGTWWANRYPVSGILHNCTKLTPVCF